MQLISDAILFLNIHLQEPDICRETISRIDKVIDAFQIKELHKNVMANFSYQAAICYCMYGEQEEAIKRLLQYVECANAIITTKEMLHSDDYFTKLDYWFDKIDLGTQLVRDKSVILESVKQSLMNPLFEPLKKEKGYKWIKYILENAEKTEK